MPSTPYGRKEHTLPNPGISGLPGDKLPVNRLPFMQNMRSYQPGTLQPRFGMAYATASVFGGGLGVHSLARLNDPTPFSTIKALRLVGAIGNLYAGDVALAPAVAGFTLVDSGYSGSPLTVMNAAPAQSPRPYAYAADSARQRKINSDKTLYPIGLAAPTVPPSVTMPRPSVSVLSECTAAADFASVPGSASTGAVGSIARINTTIATIVYDSGTTGWASINATSMVEIMAGIRLGIAAGAETEIIQECIPAVATTSIAAIVYDAGTTGLCWIQPLASLGTGLLDAIPIVAYTDRITGASVAFEDQPNVPAERGQSVTTPRNRVVDFPVNGLVTLGGAAETVRITAVAIGPDGVQAFRCVTANNHVAGNAITGLACFRVYTTGARAAGNTLTADALEIAMTGTLPSGASQVQMVGGLRSGTIVSFMNQVDATASSGDPRAALADDILTLSIKVDHLTYLDSVRLYMDCDAAGSADPDVFLRNYFLAEWRANDIVAAIQATNAAVTSTIVDSRNQVVLNNQLDPPDTITFGQ